MTSPAGRKDLELVQRAVSEHHAFVYRLSYRMLRNQADAEDLTQTVFVELLRSPGALARVSSPRAWLARVTFSKAASIKRGEARRRKREETWAKDRPEKADGDEMKTNDDVSEAIASLPDELRVPVVLHYQEGLKYREIAEVCQCAEGTIASRISTAKEKLREKLKHGGALAGFPSIEAALEAEGAVPMPAGLEERLLEGVAREFAMSGAALDPASQSMGKLGFFTGGTAFTVGTAFVLAGALMTGGWLGIRGALERDGKTHGAAAASATARRAAKPSSADGPSPEIEVARASLAVGGGATETEEAPAPDTENAAATDGAQGSPVILGWVRDHRGKPLEGVTVGVVPPGADSPARTATTDAEGYYELDSVAPAEEVISLHGQTWTAAAVEVLALDQASLKFDLIARDQEKLKLAEAEAALYAARLRQVREEHAAAQVSLTGAISPPLVSTKPTACLEQNATGTCSSCHEEMAAETRAVASYNAYVQAVQTEWLVKKKVTALSEQLAFIGVEAARYTVVAQLDGYRVEVSEPFELKEGEAIQVDLTLQTTLAITGTVLAADGSPIPDAEVAVVGHAGESLLPSTAAKTRTDADGVFVLASLPAGVYAIRASAGGFETVEAVASTGGQAPFVLPFTGSARVTVARSETGEILSGFRVDLRKGRWVVVQGVTGEDGVAQLAEVPPGDYVANTYREESTSRQSRAQGPVTVLPRRESAIRLEVADKVKAEGRLELRDPAASPADFSVKATRLDDAGEVDASPKVVQVAEDGSFKWSGGLAPGAYVIELFSGVKGEGDVVGSMDLQVTAGQAVEDLVVTEGASRNERRQAPRDGSAKDAPATLEARPLEPLPLDDRTVTVQEPMKLRTYLALLGVAGIAAITPSAEVEATEVLDRARIEATGPSGFQKVLRGALEPAGLRWAPSGGRVAIEMAAAR